jgi:hypothetical protein
MNQTARQVGGALGVATLATLVRSGGAGQASTFAHVYVFCAVAALCAGAVGLRLGLRAAGAAADERPTPPMAPAAA